MRMTSNAEARSRNSSDPGGVASFRSNAVEDENFPSENTPSIWSWAPKSRTSVAFILASLTDTILLLAAIAFLGTPGIIKPILNLNDLDGMC